MRFSVIITGTFAAVAMAQSSATTTTATAPTSVVGLTPAQSSSIACLNNCKPEDVNCRAACNGVPFPSEGQVNSTNACVADCSKNFGKGTEADNANYVKCADDCVNNNYWNSASGTPNPTGSSSGSGNGNGNGASGSSTAKTAGGSTTATGATTSATGTSDALRIGSSIAAVAGFMAAVMAI